MKRTDAILREARFLTKKNKARFNRKFRRTWKSSGKPYGTGKGGYRRNGEDMRGETMA